MAILKKVALWGVSLLIAGVLVLLILERVAAERVEVVELHTTDEAGQAMTTRLWVVDDAGFPYLRTGADGAGWFTRLQDNGEFELTRGDVRRRYTAVLRPDKSDRINALMQDKYTWGDDFIAMLVGTREGSIAIELHRQN